MIETEPQPTPLLWTPEGFRDDAWRRVGEAGALVGAGRFIMPLPLFLELDEATRAALRGRLGAELQPGEPLEAIAGHLGELALVALAFPAFNDGRSFSKAELLRGRHGFTGALRATGQVLMDQLPHMLRVGFDQFEITHPVLIARLERGDAGGIPLYYQAAAKPTGRPGKGAAYSWRRAPGG